MVQGLVCLSDRVCAGGTDISNLHGSCQEYGELYSVVHFERLKSII